VLFDATIVLGTFLLAFLIRFDFRLDEHSLGVIRATFPFLLTYFVAFPAFSLYQGVYYFSSFIDLLNITKAVAVAGAATALGILFVWQGQFPRTVLLLHPILAFMGVGGVRFGISCCRIGLGI
jgi:FlaA1/EpsC-like NDP-sugar epimerase